MSVCCRFFQFDLIKSNILKIFLDSQILMFVDFSKAFLAFKFLLHYMMSILEKCQQCPRSYFQSMTGRLFICLFNRIVGKYLFKLNNKDIRITFLSVAVVFCYCCCYCCCCGGRVVCFCFLFWFGLFCFFYADLKQVFLQSRNYTCAKVVLFKKVFETLKLSESSFEVLTKTLRCQNVSNSPIQKHFFSRTLF